MKNLLNTAILITLLLTVGYSLLYYGAATVDLAGPLFGASSLLALLWAAKLLVSPKISWIKSPVHWPVLAFVAYAGIRCLTSPVVADSKMEFTYVCFYALIYFLVACNLYHRRDQTLLFLTLMVMVLGEGIFGIWQAATLSDKVFLAVRPAVYMGRASGTFVNPNHFAGYLAIVFGLLLARIVLHRPAAKATFGAYAGPKILEGYVALVVLTGIVASGSRGSWVALGLGLVAFTMWALLPGAVSRYVVAGLVLLLVLASLVVFSAPSVRERMAELVTISKDDGELKLRDTTLGHRTSMWSASTKMIAQRPLFGSGPATWEWFFPPHRDLKLQEHPRNAHNDLLQLTAEYGIFGLLIVAAFFACYFWQVAQLSSFANYSDQRAFAVGSGLSIAVVLLHALADYHFHVPAVAMLVVILIGLAVGMESGDRYSLRVQMQRRTQIALAAGLIVIAVAGAWSGWRLVSTNRLLEAADSLKSSADFDQAREFYQKVVRKDVRQYGAHKGLGDIDLALAALQTNASGAELRADFALRAVDFYRRSLIYNPYDSEVQLGLATAFEYLNDRVQSLAAADQALVLDPNRLEVLRATGLLYFRAGQRDKASPLLMKAQSFHWAPDVNAALEAMKTSH